MENKVIKIIGIIIIGLTLINIVMMNSNTCMAISDVTQNPGGWEPTVGDDRGEDKLNQKMKPVLNIIRNVGVIISVLTLSVIALKIMFSSVEGKAEYKQKLLPWAVGAFMVFSMTTIPSLVYDLTYSGPVQAETSQKEQRVSTEKCKYGNDLIKMPPPFSGYICSVEGCGCGGEQKVYYTCIYHDYELKLRNGRWHCDKCGRVYI